METPEQQRQAWDRFNMEVARDVLRMAAAEEVPNWYTNPRILTACKVLGLTLDQAREWARSQ
jgi:hypothetical protein